MCGKADPRLLAQVDEILAQNKKILEMNEALIAMMAPPQFVQADSINIEELMRNGPRSVIS